MSEPTKTTGLPRDDAWDSKVSRENRSPAPIRTSRKLLTGNTDEYDRWNAAIAEVMFPDLDFPTPVYLDMEDEQFSAIGAKMGVAPEDVERDLAAAVAATLDLTSVSSIFALHTGRLWGWTRFGQANQEPPVLALLAVLSLAAEHMVRGDGFGDGNFYGRLRELLVLPRADERINHAYRRVAERYWGALNSWLEACGGRRGVPTAYSMTHRFVGLPISQALVRSGDRARLVSFFQRFGLAPGTELPPTEMESILDHWMSLVPCPATKNLERLWRNRSARSRISQTAVVALAAWDGRVAQGKGEGGQADAGRIALSVALSGFPKKRFELNVLVYATQPERAREARIITTSSEVGVGLVPVIQGALGFDRSANIGVENLLEGVLRLKDELSLAELVHRPRRLLVFRQDPLCMRWIETEQVLLGDDLMLVAHADLESRLTKVLATIARPGWSMVAEKYPGLPNDWRVFRDVEVFSHPGDLIPPRMDDLSALIPLTSNQLKIAGGFALPGATRGKWHSWAPPEIRAISDAPGGFEVRLVDLGSRAADADEFEAEASETLLEVWADEGEGAVVIELGSYELEDGDYRVEMIAKGASDALSATHLHLRSAETPDLMQWSFANEVAYDMGDPLAVLGAGRQATNEPVVRGATVAGAEDRRLLTSPIAQRPLWRDDRPVGRPVVASAIDLARPEPASCMYDGSHREQLEYVPTDSWGKPLTSWSVGTCSGCGLVRRYSTSYAKNARAKASHEEVKSARRRDVSLIAEVKREDGRAWDVVLDGLLHTGGGRWSLLERLAMHIEPTMLFVDEFARAMESLGHIDIRRDPQSLRPVEWEVAPAALSATPSGMLLSGQWTQAVTDEVARLVRDSGGQLVHYVQPDGPMSWFYAGVGDWRSADVERVTDYVTVQGDSWRDLAVTLPTLGSVVKALPRRRANIDGRATWFDVAQARWVDATDLRQPGAYRVHTFSTLDLVRTPEDLAQGTVAVSTVHLSKHVASMVLRGPPLLSYDRDSAELTLPLGADLPGLYGRAAVLASGFLPEQRGRQLVYSDVPPELAAHLAHLLTH